MHRLFAAALIALGLLWGRALPHESDAVKKAAVGVAQGHEEKEFGRPGERGKATRTIRINMRDTMRFEPSRLKLTQGETVRFRVHNAGGIGHEIVLGTLKELKEHAELMKKFPDMEHDESHILHVRPAGTGDLVWQFTRAGEFYYGCLIPGHFEAGMVGRISVLAK